MLSKSLQSEYTNYSFGNCNVLMMTGMERGSSARSPVKGESGNHPHHCLRESGKKFCDCTNECLWPQHSIVTRLMLVAWKALFCN